MKRIVGEILPNESWNDIHGERVPLTRSGHWTHLQFRRFAGCPMCNLHLQAFIRGYGRLQAAGVREIVVFHSSAADLKSRHANAPFPIIPDPTRARYREFGVEKAWGAVLHPRAMAALLRGLLSRGMGMPARGESLIGLPADFLIDGDGRIEATHYGVHGDDQWSVEDVLRMARAGSRQSSPSPSSGTGEAPGMRAGSQ